MAVKQEYVASSVCAHVIVAYKKEKIGIQEGEVWLFAFDWITAISHLHSLNLVLTLWLVVRFFLLLPASFDIFVH